MQTEAMARLDAVLGRSALDQPEVMPSAESLPQLRLGAAPTAVRAQPPERAPGAEYPLAGSEAAV